MAEINAAPIVWAVRPGQPDPDYGKVVDGLNCCIISDREVFCPDDCPYQDDKDGRRCETIMKQEALLLIQQQAQELHDLKKSMNSFRITVKEARTDGGT